MGEKQSFNQAIAENLPTLKQYVPVVAKVHGKTHPEFHEVKKVFDGLNKKVEDAGAIVPELTDEFSQLRQITSNYTVPNDVCESYEAVYKMLAELDKAYQA
jgi:regulator of cell morphogenesis and NO signaling